MNIKTILKNFCESIKIGEERYTFAHGEKDWQNLMSDEKLFPAIYLDEPIQSQYILHQSGLIQEMYLLSLVFLYDSQLDFTPEQHDVLKQLGRRGAKILVSELMSSPLIKSVTNAKLVEYQNEYDRNATGVFLYLYVLPYDTEPVC
jgi:hypothetical protein